MRLLLATDHYPPFIGGAQRLQPCLSCASAEYGVLKGVVAVTTVAAGQPLLARKMTGLHGVGTTSTP